MIIPIDSENIDAQQDGSIFTTYGTVVIKNGDVTRKITLSENDQISFE